MNSVSALSNTTQLLNLLGKTRASTGALPFSAEADPVNSADQRRADAPSLPTTSPLSIEAVLALQSEQAAKPPPPAQAPSAEDNFLQEAHKSPMQRMREQILKTIGLTEEQLAQMSPEDKRATEDKIARMIREKVREASGLDGGAPQTDAASALEKFA